MLLLRHGAVDWARAEDGEPPLTAAGLLDAELAASTLPRFDAIVASAQRPAQETAEAIMLRRAVPLSWRDGLDEIRTSARLQNAAAYAEWVDRLFGAYDAAEEGESLAEGVDRVAAALRATGDRYYGRSILIVSHPVILLAFRAHLLHVAVTRDQVDTMPELALAVVDYLEGRFYLVEDFPVRQMTA
jgi:broad specificity phosphatase PhoE